MGQRVYSAIIDVDRVKNAPPGTYVFVAKSPTGEVIESSTQFTSLRWGLGKGPNEKAALKRFLGDLATKEWQARQAGTKWYGHELRRVELAQSDEPDDVSPQSETNQEPGRIEVEAAGNVFRDRFAFVAKDASGRDILRGEEFTSTMGHMSDGKQ